MLNTKIPLCKKVSSGQIFSDPDEPTTGGTGDGNDDFGTGTA